MAKYNIKLNSLEKIEQLLQETYDLASKQIVHIQEEINKLTNSSPLADSTMDEKAKYAKAMHDFMGDRDKAITRKFEIAKFMGEVLKHNGDVENTVNDTKAMSGMKMDINALRNAVKDMANTDKPNVYELKKP
jgi:hypothetical protein